MHTNTDSIVQRARRCGSPAFCLIVLFAAFAPAVYAQEHTGTVDPRWEPWLGCWEPLRDTVHESAHLRPGRPLTRGRLSPGMPGETRVCVEPDAGGVRLRTEVQGRAVLQETIVADGSRRPIGDDEHGCGGWRRAEWSGDGRRLFGRAEIACAGEPPQAVTQLLLLTGEAWFEFQGITTDGREAVRVRRYRRTGDEAERTTRAQASTRAFDLEAVEEASGKVDALVLQAALVETGSRFGLDGQTMLALRDAGVPGDVTDLMIALSYPQRFRVSRSRASAGFIGAADWMGDPFWHYAPFASSYWGGGGWWWGHPRGFIVVPGGGGEVPHDGRGRVINHQGYTRIETREPARGRADGTATGSTASTSGSSGSGGSSSGVSSSGYSGGGSSGGGGRTAVPR